SCRDTADQDIAAVYAVLEAALSDDAVSDYCGARLQQGGGRFNLDRSGIGERVGARIDRACGHAVADHADGAARAGADDRLDIAQRDRALRIGLNASSAICS